MEREGISALGQLVWSPVFEILEEIIRSGDELILLVVPFVKLDALKRMLRMSSNGRRLKVIVRWKEDDLACGVSDIEVYPFLRDQEVSLYRNPRIHLKLYVFESNTAFNTSGNLTLSGLGYGESGNVEIGNLVRLSNSDWRRIYQLLNESTQIDDGIYERLKREITSSTGVKRFTKEDLFEIPRKQFTIQNLPASDSPEEFIDFYLSRGTVDNNPEFCRRCMQDVVTFDIPEDLSRDGLRDVLIAQIKANPFIRAFISALEERKTMRFGEVTAWIQEKCEDIPVPFRYEIKDAVRALYNWLRYAYDQVSWDRPSYSQILRWISSNPSRN
jgi:hypothetical protein